MTRRIFGQVYTTGNIRLKNEHVGANAIIHSALVQCTNIRLFDEYTSHMGRALGLYLHGTERMK
jgi:hypothetical protein